MDCSDGRRQHSPALRQGSNNTCILMSIGSLNKMSASTETPADKRQKCSECSSPEQKDASRFQKMAWLVIMSAAFGITVWQLTALTVTFFKEEKAVKMENIEAAHGDAVDKCFQPILCPQAMLKSCSGLVLRRVASSPEALKDGVVANSAENDTIYMSLLSSAFMNDSYYGNTASIMLPGVFRDDSGLRHLAVENGEMYLVSKRLYYVARMGPDNEPDGQIEGCAVVVPFSELRIPNRTLAAELSDYGSVVKLYFQCNSNEYCCERECCSMKTSGSRHLGIPAIVLSTGVPVLLIASCTTLITFLVLRRRGRRQRCVRPHLFQQDSYSSAAEVSSIKTSTKPAKSGRSIIKGRKEKASTKSTSNLIGFDGRPGVCNKDGSRNAPGSTVDWTPNPFYSCDNNYDIYYPGALDTAGAVQNTTTGATSI